MLSLLIFLVTIYSIDANCPTTSGGDVLLSYTWDTEVSCPTTTTVSGKGNFEGNDLLTSISMPAVTAINNGLEITNNDKVTEALFPELKTIGSALLVVSNPQLVTLDLAKLEDVEGDLSVTSNTLLVTLNLPNLFTVYGSLTLQSNNALKNGYFPALDKITGELIFLTNNVLEKVLMCDFETLYGDAHATQNPNLNSIEGCNSYLDLDTIGSQSIPITCSGDSDSCYALAAARRIPMAEHRRFTERVHHAITLKRMEAARQGSESARQFSVLSIVVLTLTGILFLGCLSFGVHKSRTAYLKKVAIEVESGSC